MKKMIGLLAVVGLLAALWIGCGGDNIMTQNVGDQLPDTHENITESCGSSVNDNGCHPGGF